MRSIMVLLFSLVLFSRTMAQTPTLVKDLLTTTSPTNPIVSFFLDSYDGNFYFDGYVNDTSTMFKSDGSSNTTVPLFQRTIYDTVVMGSFLYMADDVLWKTDGTTAGTTLIFDKPGLKTIRNLTAVGTSVFFSAEDSNGQELWVTNGTRAGTHLVKDIYPGPGNGAPRNLFNYQGKLVFAAFDGVNGDEIWTSDGTSSGTTMLKNIAAGSTDSTPGCFFEYNSKLYFSASNGTTGHELWISDGTTANTKLLKEINPGYLSSWPNSFMPFAGYLFFTAQDATHGGELWRTNGTTAGTIMITDFYPGSEFGVSGSLFVSGNKLYFSGDDGTAGFEPCVSDGTPAGTKLLKNLEPGTFFSNPSDFRALGSSVTFKASTSAQNAEMWITDGTQAGTKIIVDLAPGNAGSVLSVGPKHNNRVYFSNINDQTGLWSTDGTAAGTVRTTNHTSSTGSNPEDFTKFGSKLLFSVETATPGSRTLVVSDGTSGGTSLISPTGLAQPKNFRTADTVAFFIAGTNTNGWGYELWKTDGTVSGTSLIKTHSPSLKGSITDLTVYQNKAYYVAVDTIGLGGYVLWQSDGTSTGTIVFTSIGKFEKLTLFNNKLIYYEDNRKEISVSDGTFAGTSVEDTSYVYEGFYELNGRLIFSGNPNHTSSDVELCFFDGNTSTIIKDIWSGGSSSPNNFTAVGSLLYFLAMGSNGNWQLWKTDGTSPNTKIVKDLGTSDLSKIRLISGLNGRLYFSFNTSAHGAELWVSDGTSTGTAMVMDTFSGTVSGLSGGGVYDQRLFFSVWQPSTGQELWTSDGTTSGTHLVSDLLPGPIGNKLGHMCAFNRKLFFNGASSGDNRELWSVPILPNAAIRTVPQVCSNATGITASVMKAIGSATYSWTATNASITSASNTQQITYTAGATGQVQLNVVVTDSGGTSQKSITLPIKATFASAGLISGPTNPCIGSTVVYSVPYNVNVETYTWQVPPNSTIATGQGTHQISVTVGSTSGQVSVVAQNACVTTPPATLNMTPSSGTPAAPVSISGPNSACKFQLGLVFSTPAIAGASSYLWTVPIGATITQGQGTTSIAVNFGDNSGTITVLAKNGCGESAVFSMPISILSPPTPAAAGPDQNLSSGQTAQLNANQAIVGIGTWSVVSGPSTQASQFSSLNSNTSTFTPLVLSGTYTLRWTISNGGCSDSVDELLLVYSSPQNVDLVLQLSCTQNSPSVGEPTEFRVLLSNNGATTATGIQVTLNIHPEIEVSSHTLTHGTYFPTQSIWEIAALPAGELATLTPRGHAISLGDKPIVAEVTQCNEPDINSTPNNHVLAEDDQDQCSWQPAAFVNIPDPALKLLITSDPTMDTFDDDEISPFEASGINFIDCSYQGVADLTGLETFVNLQFLGASGNPIIELPGLQGLTALTSVFLDDCKLTSLNDSMGNFALPIPIITLSLAGNRLTHIPMEVFFMTFMQSLWLNSNPWVQVEDSFDMFPDLKFLNLSNTGLKQIPSSIGFHLGLEHIIIGLNDIRELPFILPATLKFIDLSGNKISDISPLEFCPQLEGVILFSNNLEDLTALTSIPGLLNVDSHYVMVDRNRLNSSACPEISTLVARSSSSGAYFEYNPQGNFSFLYGELPEWEVLPHRLLKWVNDVNMEAYLYNISCP